MAEHRVTMLGASLRRFEEPARSADPRIRELVAALATLDPPPAPRAHFRAELRAQLVAVAPRLIAEGPAVEAPRQATVPTAAASPAAAVLRGALRRIGEVSIARPIGVITAVIAVFAVLLGGAVWISKKALPGDALYSLKRANENVALSFTDGDTAKGREYLNLARERAGEVGKLLSRSSASASASADGAGPNAAGGVNAHTAHLIASTLDSGDTDVGNASQLLGAQAVRNGSADPLRIMTAWAPGQIRRLKSITDRIAAGPLHDVAATSTQLAAKALGRAQRLHRLLGCECLDNAAVDELGPLPCTVCHATQDPLQRSTAPGSTPAAPGSTPGVRAVPSAAPSVPARASGPSATGNSGKATTGSSSPVGGSTVSAPVIGGSSTTAARPTRPLPLPSISPVPLPTIPVPSLGPSGATQTCTLLVLGICVDI